MDGISDDESDSCFDVYGINFLNTSQESFVNSVYSSVDEATRKELERLHVEEGVVPSCKQGCFFCCGQHILTSIAEAQALGQYIKREFSEERIEDLRLRTKQWHEWDKIRIGMPSDTRFDPPLVIPDYLRCPLLVEGECSAYPMRPLVCRTHYVSSAPPACRPFNDPESIKDSPVSLPSVVEASNPLSLQVQNHIEEAGVNFHGSIMLLPHWLAIEMKWDFAIEMQFE